MITTQGWNAFLKCIEEPPKYTIFMFCTTDPQKVPDTIINRCQVHTLGLIDLNIIKNRLKYICDCEHYTYDNESLDYIAKLGEGSMRQSIAYLDKCKDYSNNITINNVIDCLGNYSYDLFFNLTNYIIDGDNNHMISLIDDFYSSGGDLKLFISKYLEFVLQLYKYVIFKDITVTTIPSLFKNSIDYTTNIEDSTKFFNKLLTKILNIKQLIKGDNDLKTTIEISLLSKTGGEN